MNERRSHTIDMCNKSTVSNYIMGNIDKLISEAKVEYIVGVCTTTTTENASSYFWSDLNFIITVIHRKRNMAVCWCSTLLNAIQIIYCFLYEAKLNAKNRFDLLMCLFFFLLLCECLNFYGRYQILCDKWKISLELYNKARRHILDGAFVLVAFRSKIGKIFNKKAELYRIIAYLASIF